MWWKQKNASPSPVATCSPLWRSTTWKVVPRSGFHFMLSMKPPPLRIILSGSSTVGHATTHQVALGHGDGVQVGGLAAGRDLRDQPARVAARGDGEQLVGAAGREVDDVGDQLVGLGVVVRVGAAHRAAHAVLPLHLPDRAERLAVELHRHRQLGHRHVAIAETGQVDVGVVVLRRREGGGHAAEQRPARVLAEAPRVEAPLAGALQGLGLEEAARVAHPPLADAEGVEHRQAVEPVAQRHAADVEQRGRDAGQVAAAASPGPRPGPGSESTCTSSSRLWNPRVWLACRSAACVAMLSSAVRELTVRTVPSTLDCCKPTFA